MLKPDRYLRFAVAMASVSLWECSGTKSSEHVDVAVTDPADGSTSPHKVPVLTPVELPGGMPGIGFDDLQWSTALGRVIVPGGRTGSVFLIDPDSLEVTTLQGFSKSDKYSAGHDFGVTSATDAEGLLYALDRTTKQLVQFDPKDKRRMSVLHLRADPDYVRFVESTRELWITEPGKGQIEIVALGDQRPPSMKSTQVVAVSGGPESLVIDQAHARAYTNSFLGSTFSIDVGTHKSLTSYKNGCWLSLGMALDVANQRVFVGCYGGEVSAFSAGSGKRVGSQDLSRGVDIISYDPVHRRVHVASSAKSELGILRVGANGTLRTEYTIPTGGSGSCVVADGAGRSWVCDPTHGRMLRVTLPTP